VPLLPREGVVMRGYSAIGIIGCKTEINVGTLWRSAFIFGAAYIFTIGKRYKQQSSDTQKAWRKIPLFAYATFDEFKNGLPFDARIVGVEIVDGSVPLEGYVHPERAVYLLGAEDHGIPSAALDRCHDVVQLPGAYCLNVSVAGSIVMYDRLLKADRGWLR